jgi:hypothetical protein
MPALTNRRRERFAREVASGTSVAVAYRRAGYILKESAGDAFAARLAATNQVAQRIAEIRAKSLTPAQARTTAETTTERAAASASSCEVTIESILRELEEARQLALAKKLPAPAVSATLSKAKIAGLTVENRPNRPLTFEGSDTEAARRVAFLLGIAGIEPPDEDQP